jgi:hypothetical protein
VFYRAADVAEWIAHEDAALRRPEEMVCREYLKNRDIEIGSQFWKLPELCRREMLVALANVQSIDRQQLEKLCDVIDRAGLCGPVLRHPKRWVENPQALLTLGY